MFAGSTSETSPVTVSVSPGTWSVNRIENVWTLARPDQPASIREA
jgi:hypothetical protein